MSGVTVPDENVFGKVCRPVASIDMTDAARPDDLAATATRVRRSYGDVLALELSAEDLQPLIDRVDAEIDDGIYVDRTKVRMVLGAACTTAARAVDQFVVAQQLPYPATRGWEDMLDHMFDRIVSRRQFVFVADAGDLLRYVESDVLHRLVSQVKSGPHCLGGGFTTVILVDDDHGWSTSRFGSAAATEAAAADGWRHAARPRYVRDNLDDD